MFILLNENVERHVKSEAERDRLISLGFKLFNKEDVEEENQEPILGEDVEEENQEQELDLKKMSVKELRQLAKEHNLVDYSKLPKDELIVFLKENL